MPHWPVRDPGQHETIDPPSKGGSDESREESLQGPKGDTPPPAETVVLLGDHGLAVQEAEQRLANIIDRDHSHNQSR